MGGDGQERDGNRNKMEERSGQGRMQGESRGRDNWNIREGGHLLDELETWGSRNSPESIRVTVAKTSSNGVYQPCCVTN